jgi:hypothetical protein
MRCPFLFGNYTFSCSALKEVYIPSGFELDEYCEEERYKICPYYCKSETEGRFIFVTDAMVPKD